MAEMKTVAAVTSLVFTLGLVCLGRPGFAQQPDSAVSAEGRIGIACLIVASIDREYSKLRQIPRPKGEGGAKHRVRGTA